MAKSTFDRKVRKKIEFLLPMYRKGVDKLILSNCDSPNEKTEIELARSIVILDFLERRYKEV